MIRKEILENLLSARFFILTGLLILLMTVAAVVGYGDLTVRLGNYELLRPTPGHPNVIIEPTPLSMIAQGMESNLTRLHEISILGITIRSNQQSVNRIFSLFAAPDLLFTIKVVLALIALLFSFDAVAFEKEQGTLKLLLSNNIRRPSLIVGKLLGRFALVAAPFTILYLTYLLTLSFLPSVTTTWDFWVRSFVVLLIALCYTLLFTAVGLFASSFSHRSATSMVAGLSFWLLFVFIMPNFGTTIARSIDNIPASDRIEMEARLNTIKAIFQRIQREKDQPAGDEGRRMFLEAKESSLRLIESYRPKMNALISTAKLFFRLTPAGSLHLLFTDISGTGLYEENRLKDAIVQYAGRNFEKINRLEPGQPDTFVYQRASLSELLLGGGFIDVLVIVFFTAFFTIAAYLAFLRYDPR